MALNPAQAQQHALNLLVMHFSDAIELVPCDSLPVAAYGIDPDHWYLFLVNHLDGPLFLGAGEYVAVHAESGEVRTLGRLGD